MLLPVAALLAASLLHFIHNAEFLANYPHMPAWLTREGVYGFWLLFAAIGIAGYVVRSRGHRAAGRMLLAAYAGTGLFVLTHYANASAGMHTSAMNVTIGLEAAAGLFLLVAVAREK